MNALLRHASSRLNIVLAAIVVASLLLRLAFINVVSPDAHYFLLPWFDQLRTQGLEAIVGGVVGIQGDANANYAPPYYYLLWLATKLDGLLPPLWMIKLVSFCFEFVGAFFAYKIVRLFGSERRALLAAVLVFAAPTTILNTTWMAQCDMIWTSLLLGSLYFSLQRKWLLTIAFFAIAISFKAQAIFFSPFLFMLLVRRELPIWAFAIAPVIYALMLVPAVSVGVDWVSAATTYFHQGEVYHRLSQHAPNLYYFFGEAFYAPGVLLGLALTAIGCFCLAILPAVRKVTMGRDERVLAAAMFLALAPFLLPKMHDRYFFAADMATILLAVFVPRLWALPILSQLSSIGAYVPMASLSFTNRILTPTMPMAAMLNTILVAYLVYQFWRVCTQPGSVIGDKMRMVWVAACVVILANVTWLVAFATQTILAGRLCQPGSNDWVCTNTIPSDWALNGSWVHWLAFAVLLTACWFIARWLVARLEAMPWRNWSSRFRAWFGGGAVEPA